MGLKAFVTDISQVEEAQRGLYKAVEGGHVVDVDPVGDWGNTNVAGLKSALAGERSTNKESAAAIAAYQAFDKYKELGVAGIDKAISDASKVGTDIETARASITAEWQDKCNALTEANASLITNNKNQLRVSTINGHLAKKASEMADGADRHFRSLLDYAVSHDETGKVVISDMNGNPIMSKQLDNHGNMSIEEYWGVLTSDPANNFALASSGASGSGATGGSGGGGGNPTAAEFAKMDGQARKAIYDANPELAMKLNAGQSE